MERSPAGSNYLTFFLIVHPNLASSPRYENMAFGWRMMFMEPQCLPSADGLIMSATMTTTGPYFLSN